MSNPNVKFKKDSPMKKLSLKEITNILLNGGNRWFPMSVIYGKKPVFITGSYVYKHLVRDESVDDVDALCDNSGELSDQIKSIEKTAYNPDLPHSYGYIGNKYRRFARHFGVGVYQDHNVIKFTGDSSVHVDLIGIPDFVARVNYTGLSLANCLVLTTEGIRHVLEVPELSDGLHLQADDPQLERDWTIRNLKEGRYCRWFGMIDKDKE